MDGRPVLVIPDPGGTRNRLMPGGGNEGVHVFRREVGSASLDGVTPLERPHVIGVFEEAPEGLLGDENG